MKKIRFILGVITLFALSLSAVSLATVYFNYSQEKQDALTFLGRVKIITINKIDQDLCSVSFMPLNGSTHSIRYFGNMPSQVKINDLRAQVYNHAELTPGRIGELKLIKDATLFGVRAQFQFIPEPKQSF